MAKSTPDFSIAVSEVTGVCPAGEANAKQNIADKKIPVLSCEGALHSWRNCTSCG